MRHRLEKDVEAGTHTYLCECGFASEQHPTKSSAERRGREHETEHETGEPMRPIGEFLEA